MKWPDLGEKEAKGGSRRISTSPEPRLSRGGGSSANYLYFPNVQDKRLQQIKNQTSASVLLSQFDYTYDYEGEIKTWTKNYPGLATAQRYDLIYDNADQVTNAPLKNATTNALVKQYIYGYDPAANRTSERVGNQTTTSTPNNVNEITSQSGGTNRTLSYDFKRQPDERRQHAHFRMGRSQSAGGGELHRHNPANRIFLRWTKSLREACGEDREHSELDAQVCLVRNGAVRIPKRKRRGAVPALPAGAISEQRGLLLYPRSSRLAGDVPKIVEKRVVLLRQIGHDLLWKVKPKTQENTLEKTIHKPPSGCHH